MSISFDELEIGACYERNGEYLGKFIKIVGNPATQSRVDDTFLKFEIRYKINSLINS